MTPQKTIGHHRQEMGADVDDLGSDFEMPGRPPPVTFISGASRASALSVGPPCLPEVTRLALFFVLESVCNLRPPPRSLSNFFLRGLHKHRQLSGRCQRDPSRHRVGTTIILYKKC